ncbi:MAG: hypothetical protein HY927_03085 [Elusimicrobia bacterium]|nr:hypothetical protein [Elusimicrobiota bacterium]
MKQAAQNPGGAGLALKAAEKGMEELRQARFLERLRAKDASLFKADPSHQKIIRNSLGWLRLPESMAMALGPVRSFAAEARQEGFKRAVVLGMGGSSLSCEVFRRCFAAGPGCPELRVLDATHPDSVRSIEAELDLKTTLFIVSSKSGSTIEPNCMLEYFFSKAAKARGSKAPTPFVAITDPGTSLEKLARERRFRKVFLNQPDIGGRYSVLSNFGLVPAALMGIDAGRLLERARRAADDPDQGLRLGAALGVLARQGRDKVTLSLSDGLAAFGLWIEQLVAESTGKEGRGILPVCEPLEGSCADDRVFVRLSLEGEDRPETRKKLSALEKAGHPVIRLTLADAYDLGAQFYRWEIATAAAGFLLGVDPFDQPDVQSAKDQTRALLSGLQKGALPKDSGDLRAGNIPACCDAGLASLLGSRKGTQLPLGDVLSAHFGRLKAGDYAAILAFMEESPEARRLLESLRERLRAATPAPVTLGFGPRYLHSTGQLYKGGAPTGVFLVLSQAPAAALPIPGEKFGFDVLCQAQARGDFEAMRRAGRRVLRLDLDAPVLDGLRSLVNAAGACRAGG